MSVGGGGKVSKNRNSKLQMIIINLGFRYRAESYFNSFKISGSLIILYSLYSLFKGNLVIFEASQEMCLV